MEAETLAVPLGWCHSACCSVSATPAMTNEAVRAVKLCCRSGQVVTNPFAFETLGQITFYMQAKLQDGGLRGGY